MCGTSALEVGESGFSRPSFTAGTRIITTRSLPGKNPFGIRQSTVVKRLHVDEMIDGIYRLYEDVAHLRHRVRPRVLRAKTEIDAPFDRVVELTEARLNMFGLLQRAAERVGDARLRRDRQQKPRQLSEKIPALEAEVDQLHRQIRRAQMEIHGVEAGIERLPLVLQQLVQDLSAADRQHEKNMTNVDYVRARFGSVVAEFLL